MRLVVPRGDGDVRSRTARATVSLDGAWPATGFIRSVHGSGYTEAPDLYVLGLVADPHGPEKRYLAWTSHIGEEVYGRNFSTAPACSCISSPTRD